MMGEPSSGSPSTAELNGHGLEETLGPQRSVEFGFGQLRAGSRIERG
jgi:hypothetical protein